MWLRIFAFLFVSVFAVTAIYLTYMLLSILVRVEASKAWVPVEGQLISSVLERDDDPFEDGAPVERLLVAYLHLSGAGLSGGSGRFYGQ